MNEAQENRVISFLGLCKRAGKLVSGQEACVELARSGRAALVLLDEAASDNTRKRITDACRSHDTPLWTVSGGSLGHAIGQRGRMVIAMEAGSMADHLLSILPAGEQP